MSVKVRKLNFKYICINKYQISRNNINFNLIKFFNMQEIYNENFTYICIYIYFGCAWSLLLHRLFSSCSKWRLLSSCVRTFHSGGFSCGA